MNINLEGHRQISFLAGTALAVSLSLPAVAAPDIPVFVDGDRLPTDARLVPAADRTLLPMRELFESLGARVTWDNSRKVAVAWTDDGRGVRIPVGERQAQILEMHAEPRPGNWGEVVEQQRLDAPARIIGGRTYIPLRFASEALNAGVRYSAAGPTIHIDTEAVAGTREERRALAQALNLRLDVPEGSIDPNRQKPVNLRLTVRNTGRQAVTLPFQSSQRYELQVLQNGRVVWNWAHGQFFTQAIQRRELAPGEELVFSQAWNLRTNEGPRIEPGRYTVRGALLIAGAPRSGFTEEATLTIGTGGEQTCLHREGGFRVSYPAGWHANPGDVMPECSVFDPNPVRLEEGTEIPFSMAVSLRIENVPFQRAASVGREARVLSREETTVDGRRAVRLETRSTGAAIQPEGMLSYRYVVDLNERTLIATTYDAGSLGYARKKQVLDRMMNSLNFTR